MRRFQILLWVGIFLLLTGCWLIPNVPAVQAPAVPTQTPLVNTQEPIYVVVTATPEIVQPIATSTQPEIQIPENVTPQVEQTQVQGSDSITISRVVDLGAGKAAVFWESVGEFPSGFKIVWSDLHVHPTYPEDASSYASDPNSRAAMISGQFGKIYYVRVCRFVNDQCDLYSNLGIFVFLKPSSTQLSPTSTLFILHTKTPGGGGGGGTVVPNSIKITNIVDGGPGKALISWEAFGTFTNGFKIVYSKTSTTPVFGTDPYFVVKDGTTRAAYVDGASGTKYYYRICRYTGTTCDMYSNAVSYSFPGSVITSTPKPTKTTGPTSTPNPTKTTSPTTTPVASTISITNIISSSVGLGKAVITWTAIGEFPTGFKILYSKTNTLPTLVDQNVDVSDGNARSAIFSGDPGATYFVRMCKYFNSTCAVYSSVREFTFDPEAAVITITGVVDTSNGNADINWTASGAFPQGFKILMSTTNPNPTLSDTVIGVNNGILRTYAITVDAGSKYYIRICKYDANTCTKYSPVYQFTFAKIDLTGVTETTIGTGRAEWTAAGSFPSGFILLKSLRNPLPKFGNDPSEPVPGGGTASSYSFSIIPGLTYHIRICQSYSSQCAVYSNVITFNSSAVMSLSVGGSVAGQATLTWALPSPRPSSGYGIIRLKGTGDPALDGKMVDSVLDPKTGTFVDIGLISGSTYSYRVCTLSGLNCTAYSNKVTFKIP